VVSNSHRQEFFESVQQHSQIKLQALERYLIPWARKLGSRPGVNRVWIVDGFAGTGVYASGELGSAGRALEIARSLNADQSKFKVACFFSERDRGNHAILHRLADSYRDVEVIDPRGSFWDQIDTVGDFVKRDPALIFVDPFGLGDLKFQHLVTLCKRLNSVDLMVNFASPVARRLATDRSHLIDEAVGGTGWTFDSLTDVFCDRLRRGANFLAPAVLPVQTPLGGLKYEMILAARHPAAYELWNDEIARADRVVIDGADAGAISALVDEAVELLDRMAPRDRRYSRRELLTQTYLHNCGEFHTRVLLRAVDKLVSSAKWQAATGPKDTRPMWRI
jgi:three-Cys-motif partner protein